MISYAVMAHPDRERYVADVIAQLPRPQTTVVWDTDNDVWDTGRRAILAGGDFPSERHCVIQDDAVIADSFHEEHKRLLAHVPPDAPVSHYMGRSRTEPHRFDMRHLVTMAGIRSASFAVFPGPWWGVAVTYPADYLAAVVDHGDRLDLANYDHRVAHYFQSVGVDCWYPVPSTVNHRRGPSLTGRNGRRTAAAYQPRPRSWRGRHVTVDDLPGHLRRRFPPTPM